MNDTLRLLKGIERLLAELRRQPPDSWEPDNLKAFEGELSRAALGAGARDLEESIRSAADNATTLQALDRLQEHVDRILRESLVDKRTEIEGKRFLHLLRNAADSILMIDARTGRILDSNETARQALSYSRDELHGLSFQDVEVSLRPTSEEAWRDWVDEVRTAENPRLVEGVYRRRDGGTYPVETSLSLGSFGGQECILASSRNIVERKELEKRIRHQWRFFSQALDGSLDGFFAFDRNCSVTFWNPAMERIFGVEKAKILGRNAFEALPWLKELGEDRSFLEALNGGTVPSQDLPYKAADSDRNAYFDAFYSPLFDESGEVAGGIGIVRDVTERNEAKRALDQVRTELEAKGEEHRRAQQEASDKLRQEIVELKMAREALVESEEKFRMLVENLPDDILTVDRDGHIVFLNRAWPGTITEEVIVADFYHYIRSEYHDTFRRSLERVFDSAEPDSYEVATVNGKWYENRLVPLVRDDQVVAGMIIATEITSRKKAEEEQSRLQGQVQQASKMESLGLLAGGIARDYDDLLTEVLSQAGLALMELPPDSTVRHGVEQIEAAAIHATELTQQLLAYAGKSQRNEGALDLSQFVREIEHSIRTVVSPESALDIQADAQTPPIQADASQIRQLLLNLVSNASESLGEEGGLIRVSTGTMVADRKYLSGCYLGEERSPGPYVFVEVSDTGRGLSAEAKEKLFVPFFTTKTSARGLGLATVLGVVRGHRGAIRVESEPQHGAVFRVLLGYPEPPPGETVERERAERSILVADDDEAVRSLAKVILEEIGGYNVLVAGDGRAAVEIFRRHRDEIAAVLLDLVMPQLDGEGALDAIRQIDPTARVVLMSGYGDQEALGRFAGKGLSGFIKKPFQSRELVEKLGEVMKAGSSL